MEMDGETNGTATTNPTSFLDPADNKETVEVGVIVIGLCCICLVACALVILQLRSNNRRITGNRQRNESAEGGSGDRTRDPLDIEGPPSYDAVIRSPHLYPPSRRTSITLDVLDTRRSSASSTFSLSLHSPRFIHHSRVVIPRGASEDNLSQHSDHQLRGYHVENNEEPPPPYPGNVVLITSRDARSTDYICRAHSRSADQSSRTRVSETGGTNVPRSTSGRSLGGHVIGPHGSHVVNAWADNEAERRTSHSKNSEGFRTHGSQSNTKGRTSVVQRDRNVSRTFVSHSSSGAREAVSTTHTVPPENVPYIDTL